MSSRGGGGRKPSNSSSSKCKSPSEVSSPKVEQLSQSVADISLDAGQDAGQWEVISRKTKNRGGSAPRPLGTQNSSTKAWGNQEQNQSMRNNGGLGRISGNSYVTQAFDSKRAIGRGNTRPQSSNRSSENNYMTSQPTIPPPLEHGWNWQYRAGSASSKVSKDGQNKDNDVDIAQENTGDNEEDEDDAIDDTDDELLSEDYDSEESQKSHETRKKSRWFQKFFESLDSLSVEEINDPARQWHCPACQNGPGAIDWYRGLQPLMTHAKTKGSKRVRLHRELAELLDEELRKQGSSVIPSGEAFGKWQGLKVDEKDHEIVWPPMVIIMNTRLDQDDNDKWVGMGNQELFDYFSGYAAQKARHSYGPQGHRGMSVLIFESSPMGYLEAERLHKHFEEQGNDRSAWDRRPRSLFHYGGNRQLYGYMAQKEDLDIFNQHSQGKSKLKFEMRSYIEMVVNQLSQISEDNQKLTWYKTRFSKEQMRNKTLEESLEIVSDKLRKTTEENRIVRQRTQMHHEQTQEELEYQEQFYKDQLKVIHEARDAKEEDFENLQQKERKKAKQLGADPSNNEEYQHRLKEMEKFIDLQDEEMKGYVEERDMLFKALEENFAAMRRRHLEEELELEEKFNAELAALMQKYTPKGTDSVVRE